MFITFFGFCHVNFPPSIILLWRLMPVSPTSIVGDSDIRYHVNRILQTECPEVNILKWKNKFKMSRLLFYANITPLNVRKSGNILLKLKHPPWPQTNCRRGAKIRNCAMVHQGRQWWKPDWVCWWAQFWWWIHAGWYPGWCQCRQTRRWRADGSLRRLPRE